MSEKNGNWYAGKISEPLIEGEPMILGGQTFILPPAKVRQVRAMAPLRKVLRESESDSEATWGALAGIAAMALARNYPEMTADLIEDHLSVTELNQLNVAITRLATQGNNDRGEAEAAQRAAKSSTT